MPASNQSSDSHDAAINASTTTSTNTSAPSAKSAWRLDPVYRNARRETAVIVAICFGMLSWALVSARLLGFGAVSSEVASESVTFGVPTWVFWSLLLPWLVGTAITGWFCFGYLADDPLGDDDLAGPPVGDAGDLS